MLTGCCLRRYYSPNPISRHGGFVLQNMLPKQRQCSWHQLRIPALGQHVLEDGQLLAVLQGDPVTHPDQRVVAPPKLFVLLLASTLPSDSVDQGPYPGNGQAQTKEWNSW